MNPVHHAEAVIESDGKLTLDCLPFPEGQAVEVILLPITGEKSLKGQLHGSVIHYEHPTESVAEADWGVLQ
jgi:hypothetical protein